MSLKLVRERITNRILRSILQSYIMTYLYIPYSLWITEFIHKSTILPIFLYILYVREHDILLLLVKLRACMVNAAA